MKNTDSLQDYFSIMREVVDQIRKYRDELLEQKVVEKILWSLSKKYERAVTETEELKDLNLLTVDELLSSL